MKRQHKRFISIFILIFAGFFVFVEIANRHSSTMTFKQKILKVFYPVLMNVGKLFGKKVVMKANTAAIKPAISFYSLSAIDNNGNQIDFEQFKGKKVLLVNTASECGFTPQYQDLQKLSDQYKNKLVIIGFPANDFGEQEKGTDQEIAQFCQRNYGVSFPLAQKSSVVKGEHQNKIFEWLSSSRENGWNDQQPTWNFSKYLINEQGVLTHYFESAAAPLGVEMISAISR